MMSEPFQLDAQLAAVAARLKSRRESVLARWRQSVSADAQVAVADSLSRVQFVDHIPEILEGLHEALRAGGGQAVSVAIRHASAGSGHGQHRWQQGYSIIELMREWSHLHTALLAEMQQFTDEHPGLDLRAIHVAYRTIAQLCLEGMSESTREFERMQRTEAAGQVNDLGHSLQAVRELEQRQAEILRGAAHDLRGNMGIVSNATSALTLSGLPEERRAELLETAQRAVRAHTRLLSDLMDLARLQAGYEKRQIEKADVARMLRELCELTHPVATERGLFLHFEGPHEFEVEVDLVKVGRVVQNLLLNALHYTVKGGVTVQWGDSDAGDTQHWRVLIRDTGPGISQGSAAPLANAIEQATHDAPDSTLDGTDTAEPAGTALPNSAAEDDPRPGEGIGLSIVKRLCELLDATLEMQSSAGEGTSFAVLLPRRYSTA